MSHRDSSPCLMLNAANSPTGGEVGSSTFARSLPFLSSSFTIHTTVAQLMHRISPPSGPNNRNNMDPRTYLEHLTDVDLSLLVEVTRTGDTPGLHEFLEEDGDRLRALLASDALYDVLFGSGTQEALLRASPFMIFAVLISRAHADLKDASFVDEWLGPSRRVPVFEVASLHDFSADMAHQLFLAEVLASYTRVASGTYWVHTPRGWQRRRYSELDLMRLIEMLDIVPEAQQPAVLRRLGDLALFLTGVFPDFSGARVFRPTAVHR